MKFFIDKNIDMDAIENSKDVEKALFISILKEILKGKVRYKVPYLMVQRLDPNIKVSYLIPVRENYDYRVTRTVLVLLRYLLYSPKSRYYLISCCPA